MFHDQLPLVSRYAGILASDGVERGMIGPREVPRLWDRHLVNSGVVLPRLPQGATVADVGSGAGLPGLVWAIGRPDLQVTLVEPLLRRTTFLDEVVAELDLTNVRVVRSRAEDVDETFDVVTARAVAALEKLAKWCMPLVKPGGVLLALKGQSAPDELESAKRTLGRLGATDTLIRTYGEVEVPTTVVEVTK
ncbi:MULTISPECIES: 16S rRNA (guanine(527)-N(7))-methyltransferase RsmG [unclassified Aeromicrobium]|uniref:16S rRNA (guanine(527)-N(7))-methyltransferase RsmG n=1 Tax=unclassified Aeromicrobium TaxID=2633570 RepID=UPI001F38F474|nr:MULTISPECIES: 16S rRNA (guanine(527)-N(7))-methyltransferase RsmG [unclassified Aeromicrobium]